MIERIQPRPVVMYRDSLATIPSAALPLGYGLRSYRQGDERTWTRIQASADLYNAIGLDLFAAQFSATEEERARRILFIERDDGEPVGTAAAWFGTEAPWKDVGRVHWVAVLPEYQGLGLGKPLLAALLSRLRELGHDDAYLTTSSARVPAIALYTGFGFRVVEKS